MVNRENIMRTGNSLQRNTTKIIKLKEYSKNIMKMEKSKVRLNIKKGKKMEFINCI